MKHYVVMIKQTSGAKKYLRFLSVGGAHSYAVRLVAKRSQATRFDTDGLANWVSERFWETHWNSEKYESRTTEEIKIKK